MIINLEDLRKEKLKHYFNKIAGKKMYSADRIKFKKTVIEKYGYRNRQGRKTLCIPSFNKSQFAKESGYELKSFSDEKPLKGSNYTLKYWVLSPVKGETV